MPNNWGGPAVAVAVAAILSGCVTTQEHEIELAVAPNVVEETTAGKPEPLRRLLVTGLKQGKRNRTLNDVRTGVAALEIGDLETARQSFDQALNSIESVYANNPDAEKARSLWTKENIKEFKGEPYERAMAYYYRGLLYLAEGDYENARAAFKGGQLQDAFAEDGQNRSDFASLSLLESWASQCNGDKGLAEDAAKEVLSLKKDIALPAENHRLLVVFETGRGPIKAAQGQSKEKLVFQRGESIPFLLAEAATSEASVVSPLVEDLLWQAQTRGGRPVDHILAGKAQFKETADVAGDVLLTAGTATMVASGGNRDAAIAGAVLLLAGAIAKGTAAAARPEADLRQWDNLPDSVVITTLPATKDAAVAVKLYGADGMVLPGADYRLPIQQGKQCSIAWGRTTSALAVPDAAPNSAVRAPTP